MDNKINSLKPGQSIEISASNGKYETAERSGNGKVIRFVRHSSDGQKVFRTSNFADRS